MTHWLDTGAENGKHAPIPSRVPSQWQLYAQVVLVCSGHNY